MDGNFDSVSFDGSVGGFDTDAAPTPSATGAGGSSGRPIYKRRNWRETKQVIEEGLQSVYEEITAAKVAEATAEAVKIVKPFADKAARFRSSVRPSEVDWQALERDADLARRLLDIHARYVADVQWQQLLAEDEQILLLN